jgi:uncharacterized protein YfaS (alpha-2-macroglobulin family)
MQGKKRVVVAAATLALSLVGVWWAFAKEPPIDQRREALTKTFHAGNFKDAYDGLRQLALAKDNDPKKVGGDMDLAVQALMRLGRLDEIDPFREAVIAAHADNWRLLMAAANSYAHTGVHFGHITAGKFHRGHQRGGNARYVNVQQRDRARALQLMNEALPLTKKDPDRSAVAHFHEQFAHLLVHGAGQYAPWRLQYLTDLTKLPDYDEGYNPYYYGGGSTGAPVDADGNPIFYHVPRSYEPSKNDGERWRWNLAQAAELDAGLLSKVELELANFCRGQYGVQTMASYGYRLHRPDDAKGDKNAGTFALHTLADDETIARLATGLKRFKLPDEFNWIKIYERVADRDKSGNSEAAFANLAQEYEDRRQYVKAADVWRRAIQVHGPGPNNHRQQRLDQIVGNWGRFEPNHSQPAGGPAKVDFRFRNGNKVTFEAHAINVPKLLADVKNFLRANPNRLNWNDINIANLGYRLVEENQKQYLGAKVAGWDQALTPRANHWDDLVTVSTPLSKPGAYLVTSQMAGGNVSRVIVWINDTAIVKKQLDQQTYYFIADARTGRPVPNATVELFGWRQVGVAPNGFRVESTTVNRNSDPDGQVYVSAKDVPEHYQWLITATRAGKDGEPNRFAYLGFTGIWFGRVYDQEYNQTRVFTITDRPVYRPEQTVQFKFWVRHAKYDQPDTSDFAGRTFQVEVRNPKGEKVLEKSYTADEYGGLAGELYLPKGTTLGVYNLMVVSHGGGSFRVEEYKKPEFEVTVDAPKEPVRLGDKIEATITAKYYFGAPVTKAKVKYKVLRTSADATWYPYAPWDWFYGPGYWWFSPNYAWYPGWERWGCLRPVPPWWGRRHEQPEVVAENTVDIGADGTVKVPIDTLPAKELHGDEDHKYSITAEVVDESRRTIVGTGDVLVARQPFRVFAWLDRGYFKSGDTVTAHFKAQTLDKKPVEGKGELTLLRVSYNEKHEPVEKAVETWKLDTTAEGTARQQFTAAQPGQYRLSYRVTGAKDQTIEGGYLFVVRGEGFTGEQYRFNDIELVTDKKEYRPGEKVKLMINTDRDDATVLVFVRPTNNVYLAPRVLHLKGKSTVEEVGVVQKDMPNFFVEAMTVSNGRVHTEMREVVVPPEKRVLNVAVEPSQPEYKPGQKATVSVRLTDHDGKPFVGSTVVSVYDKSVEYISGGSNVPEIKEFFWKWRRHHHPQVETNLGHWFHQLLKRGETPMANLGVFGETVVDELAEGAAFTQGGMARLRSESEQARRAFGMPAAPGGAPLAGAFYARGGLAEAKSAERQNAAADRDGALADARAVVPAGGAPANGTGQPPDLVHPTVRRNFADTAYWNAALTTDKDGKATVTFDMPENLTAWKIRVWGMGHGTKVGQGEAVVTTKKDLLVRLQAPRFFVQTDEVVLSANVHNYLKDDKQVKVSLDLSGGTLKALDEVVRTVSIKAGGEQRVDWKVKVVNEGEAIVRMTAQTDVDADAMEMRFPCLVHGMEKFESFTGVVRPGKDSAKVTFSVPAERRVNDARLEVRYTPTLAGAMVDALPYLVDYPYGCTEQTLNRFLPTVITQKILLDMKLNLAEIQKHRTNLNAQEIGDDKERLRGGKVPHVKNPVFDEAEVKAMTRAGVDRLASMQVSDGGWGWFSGFGERSYPHTTAVVVHGLQIAKASGVQLPGGMLERGVQWLKNYQAEQLRRLLNAPSKTEPWKEHADNLDAFVYMELVDAGLQDNQMMDFLYRDRNHLAVYAKAMFGVALHKQQQADKLAMILRNVEQYLVSDDENQTAYLRLPEGTAWWYWYGNDTEANAYYLKLLSRTNPKGETASRLVKYLLNNRKHGTFWDSTRDTAVCIEAMAEYLKASGEDRPDMTIEVWLDGKKHKEVAVTPSNLFSFDNKLVLVGDAVETGKHTLEIRRKGAGPVYFNAYLTNFTLEDFITKAGLEVKVNRKYYKLTRVEEKVKVQGARGQAVDQQVEKYQRTELPNLSTLKSGDLIEIELEIDSKNDYEYLVFEDPKAAGCEPFSVRSGYTRDGMSAYMEVRDEKVCFFVRSLPRGKHSIAYKMRAEIPGRFSALPTRGYAMYAPELRGNSDEIKISIRD